MRVDLRIVFLLLALLTTAVAAAAEQAFDLAITGGKVAAERRTIRVAKGDEVVLRWTSDRPIALHLHGYDLEAKVPAGQTTAMRFTARIAGRFPVSEHTHGPGHHRAVIYLEVFP